MLTFLVGTQTIAVGMTSAFLIYNLTKSRYTKLKLIHKCKKSGFKHYRHY